MSEKLLIRLNVLRAETMGKLNDAFRGKVQLEERLKENEVEIHYYRGVVAAFDTVEKTIKEIERGERIEELRIPLSPPIDKAAPIGDNKHKSEVPGGVMA